MVASNDVSCKPKDTWLDIEIRQSKFLPEGPSVLESLSLSFRRDRLVRLGQIREVNLMEDFYCRWFLEERFSSEIFSPLVHVTLIPTLQITSPQNVQPLAERGWFHADNNPGSLVFTTVASRFNPSAPLSLTPSLVQGKEL